MLGDKLDAVEAMEHDVGQIADKGLAPRLLNQRLVVVHRGAKDDVDVGVQLHEALGDGFMHLALETVGMGDFDRHRAGGRWCGGRKHGCRCGQINEPFRHGWGSWVGGFGPEPLVFRRGLAGSRGIAPRAAGGRRRQPNGQRFRPLETSIGLDAPCYGGMTVRRNSSE